MSGCSVSCCVFIVVRLFGKPHQGEKGLRIMLPYALSFFQGLPVGASVMEPAQFPDEIRGKLDAFRVDGEAPFIDPAFPCDHIQVTTRGPGEEYGAVVVLDLFKAAEAAPCAEGFPGIVIVHGLFQGHFQFL